jgi:hypothetical protein
MATITQLASGLGGAVGSELQPSHSRLLFVEFDGKLSALNFVPTTVSSGTKTLKGILLSRTHPETGEPHSLAHSIIGAGGAS